MWQFLFGWRGRISRASFCLFAAIGFVLFLVLMAALYFRQIMEGGYETGIPAPLPSTPLGIAGAGAWYLALFLLFVALLGVSTKRLHDRDRSAWWLLVFLIAPNALSSLGAIMKDRHLGQADLAALGLNVLATVLFIWGFIELACLRGVTGPNRFGQDPLKRTPQ